MLSYHGAVRRLCAAFCVFAGCFAAGDALAEPPFKVSADGTAEVQVTKPSRTLVVFLSGDGGLWGDLDVQLAKRLAAEGFAVVALDSRIWFGEERKANEVAAHVAELMRTYLARTHATRIVLAGYSYGADVIPIAYNRLAPEWRAQIASLLLIMPTRMTMLQVTMAERTGLISGDYNLIPEYSRLPAASIVCIYGQDEAALVGCTLPQLNGAAIVALPGGHHFDNNANTLGDRVIAALKAKGLP